MNFCKGGCPLRAKETYLRDSTTYNEGLKFGNFRYSICSSGRPDTGQYRTPNSPVNGVRQIFRDWTCPVSGIRQIFNHRTCPVSGVRQDFEAVHVRRPAREKQPDNGNFLSVTIFYILKQDRLRLVGDLTPDSPVYGKCSGTGHVQCPANIQAPDMSGIRQDFEAVHVQPKLESRTCPVSSKNFMSGRPLICRQKCFGPNETNFMDFCQKLSTLEPFTKKNIYDNFMWVML